MDEPKQRNLQSVERVFMILECFKNNPENSLTEISRSIGLHKSTTYGLVTTLKNLMILEQNNETKKYRLGLKLFRIGSWVQLELREICQPFLEDLLKSFDETVNLMIPYENSIVYIDKRECFRSVKISTRVGSNYPMYCTAAGKAILAFLPNVEMETILKHTDFSPYTKHTITDHSILLKELTDIRNKKYALDNEELEYGLICISSPILNYNTYPVGAISISAPKSRMNESLLERIVARLLITTDTISKMLP